MLSLYAFIAGVVVLGGVFAAFYWTIGRKAKAEVEKTVLEANNRKYKNAEKIAARPASNSYDDLVDRL